MDLEDTVEHVEHNLNELSLKERAPNSSTADPQTIRGMNSEEIPTFEVNGDQGNGEDCSEEESEQDHIRKKLWLHYHDPIK